jgi:predicted dehydrogenase
MAFTRRDFLEMNAALAAMTAQTASANERVQIGVIGCGARSHELMQSLLSLEQARIVAVVDAYKGRTERAVERVGKQARVLQDYREVLADKSIDAVVVATPDHWHKQMVVDALRAGKDVYCEKPLTFRSSDGLEIIAAAKETGRIVQVGSQGVSTQAQNKAKEMIQAGKLGKVTMIRAAYNRNTASGAWLYPYPPDASPSTVDWEKFLGPAPKRQFDLARFFRWRCFEDYSGGIATDLFVHLCTTIHYLMDARMPSRVVALGELYRWKENREVPDTLNAILEYPEGFTVNLSSTFNNETAGEGSFQFLGTEGTVNIGWGTLTYLPESAAEDNAWIVESWPKAMEEAYWNDPKVRKTEAKFNRAPKPKEQSTHYREEGLESSIAHLGRFVEAVQTRKPFWEDATAGHHAAACAHMINRSAKTGRLVEWDFAKDDIKA